MAPIYELPYRVAFTIVLELADEAGEVFDVVERRVEHTFQVPILELMREYGGGTSAGRAELVFDVPLGAERGVEHVPFSIPWRDVCFLAQEGVTIRKDTPIRARRARTAPTVNVSVEPLLHAVLQEQPRRITVERGNHGLATAMTIEPA
jgi:hypothetical protein